MKEGKHLAKLGESLDLIRQLEEHCRDLRAVRGIDVEAQLTEIEQVISLVRDELNEIIRSD